MFRRPPRSNQAPARVAPLCARNAEGFPRRSNAYRRRRTRLFGVDGRLCSTSGRAIDVTVLAVYIECSNPTKG